MSRGSRWADFVRRAGRMELRIYESLWRSISRRPMIADGAQGFRYHRPVLTILIVFIALSALEIPIIDTLVHRWPAVRIGFLVLGIWGLTWMIGLFCAYLTRPHTVGPEGIRVREGLELDILVDWEAFASIRVAPLVEQSIDPTSMEKPGRVFEHDGKRVCAIWVGGESNLAIDFEQSTRVRLPGSRPRGGEHVVDQLRFYANDPEEVLVAVRAQLTGGGGDR